ncbi:MAG TPA: tripartite tricarboxylate transporter substrate binding protein [Xanthobacteraceae bacterium]|nr:tripartite tricarboxylate transporter substrate binding protein [Xanthobacteraceae bacterium]
MISRRKVLEWGGAALCAGTLGGRAGAQGTWPARDIHTICPFPPGTGADIVVRYYAKVLQDRVNRTVVVENRPGAFGNIATEAIARSKPDGYTVGIMASSAIAAAPSLFKTLTYDPVKDFDQVATLMRVPWFMLVPADSPYKTVADLTAYLKQRGDKASYGSVANSGVISSELYKVAFDLKTVEVKYKDPFSMLNDLYAGNLAFVHLDATTTIGSIKNGKLRLLASSTKKRAAQFPDVPSAAEVGIANCDLAGWWGIAVPKGTPQAIRDRLEKIYVDFVASGEHAKWVASIGCEPFPGDHKAAEDALVKEMQAWQEYVRVAKIEKI